MVLVLRRHTPKYAPGQDPLRHLAVQSTPEPTGSEEAPPLEETPEEKAPVPTFAQRPRRRPRTAALAESRRLLAETEEKLATLEQPSLEQEAPEQETPEIAPPVESAGTEEAAPLDSEPSDKVLEGISPANKAPQVKRKTVGGPKGSGKIWFPGDTWAGQNQISMRRAGRMNGKIIGDKGQSSDLRLYQLAFGHADNWGHANFLPNQLSELIGVSERQLRNLIRIGIAVGTYAPDSNLRCIWISREFYTRRKSGSGARPCQHHDGRQIWPAEYALGDDQPEETDEVPAGTLITVESAVGAPIEVDPNTGEIVAA